MSDGRGGRRKPPLDPAYVAQGTALTEALVAACAPLVNGQPTDLVIDAMAATFLSILKAATMDRPTARLVLHRYADRIVDYAEDIK